MARHARGWLLGCLLVGSGGLLVLALFATALGLRAPWAGLGGGTIGLVMVEGPIGDVRHLVDEIEANRRDRSVQAVVVRIDSPGGEVAPSQELHQALLRLREDKPLVASLGSVAASGGYYAAVAADSIVANPGTLTGSIGVVFDFPTIAELLDKIGVDYRTFKSGPMKDIGTFTRAPTEAEEAVLDAIIADVYDQFVGAVVEGRALTREEVLAVADGRVFSGRQALDAGLVDKLGDLHAAIGLAAELAGIEGRPRVVRKARPIAPVLFFLDRLLREGAFLDSWPTLQYRFR